MRIKTVINFDKFLLTHSFIIIIYSENPHKCHIRDCYYNNIYPCKPLLARKDRAYVWGIIPF